MYVTPWIGACVGFPVFVVVVVVSHFVLVFYNQVGKSCRRMRLWSKVMTVLVGFSQRSRGSFDKFSCRFYRLFAFAAGATRRSRIRMEQLRHDDSRHLSVT